MMMEMAQKRLLVGACAGISLLLHLLSAGNFLQTETWFISTVFCYLHSLCNFAARIALLSVVTFIYVDAKFPYIVDDFVQNDEQTISKYLTLVPGSAAVCMGIRYILPGPVGSFSVLYKLSLLASVVAMAVTALFSESEDEVKLQRKRVVRHRDKQPEAKDVTEKVERSTSTVSTAYIPSKRQRTAMELLQTESSYLRNLNTIIKVYKEPLEKALESGNPLMSQKDIESAFGGLPAIVALHSQIHEDLKDLIDDWQEDCCIADVITKYEDQLLTVYPPYVNYFDWGKELILKQQKSNADLRNFFTDCFNKPESLKQPLDALLIRPVQRLPSMSLLINDLHKRTASNLPDHNQLDNAKRVLKKVLSHINEDKRKTEGKMKIFDIVYQVDHCPIEVVSGNRLFISRIEVTTLSDGLYRSGERLALYLLTDKLEVAKWRNRSHGKSALLLKHIDLMSLCNIEQVMDVRDGGDGCENMFAVKYKVAATPNNEEEEKLSVLQSLDSSIYKQQWVTSFATQVAEMKGNDVTSDDIIRKIDPHDLANMLKKGSKLYKKLKASKSKSD